jgi:hypothetical protein
MLIFQNFLFCVCFSLESNLTAMTFFKTLLCQSEHWDTFVYCFWVIFFFFFAIIECKFQGKSSGFCLVVFLFFVFFFPRQFLCVALTVL